MYTCEQPTENGIKPCDTFHTIIKTLAKEMLGTYPDEVPTEFIDGLYAANCAGCPHLEKEGNYEEAKKRAFLGVDLGGMRWSIGQIHNHQAKAERALECQNFDVLNREISVIENIAHGLLAVLFASFIKEVE